MPAIWISTIIRLILLGLAGLLVGWLYGQPLAGLLIVCLFVIAWFLFWLFRLDRWLRGEKIEYLPDGSGIWAQIFANVSYLKSRTKRRGKRLKALIKNLRQATKSFPDGGIILSQTGEILICNRAAEQLLGLRSKRDRGQRIQNLVRHPHLKEYLAVDHQESTVEIPSPLDGGRWLSFKSVPYGLDQRLLLVRDVTERHKSDRMRRDFVANASHELRTPLTVITGYLDALTESLDDSDGIARPVREMQLQANRMRTLVEELLRLSELESKSAEFTGEPLDMQVMIEAACRQGSAMADVRVQIEARVESDKQLRGDASDIQSVLANLVANAVRATPEGGEVTVTWRTDKAGGYLEVSDTGEGVASEHIPRLTERFYRVEDGRQRTGGEGGTGLGLAIVKHALMRHKAALNIESKLGVGSKFSCHFPPERIVSG
jgi:two-component system phosphate regulon sensor histidine kinase PhoR